MRVGVAIDPQQGFSEDEMVGLVREAAGLGYDSAWTPARADDSAFARCVRWHAATGLPVGIAAVPASGQPPHVYAARAASTWEATAGSFTLAVGGGAMEHPASAMPGYLAELRGLLPAGLPLFVAALGPRMLEIAGRLADGVSLNWSTPEQTAWSRERVRDSAQEAGRPAPLVAAYIRTSVDPDPLAARAAVSRAVLAYALGSGGYRRHFERMGFGGALRGLEAAGRAHAEPDASFVSAVAAAGAPGEARREFERLAAGLDLAIVRVVVSRGGDAGSARRVLEECAPAR